MKSIVGVSLFLFSVFVMSYAHAAKHAFILGNAEYRSLSQLANTHADAMAYRNSFGRLGYSVDYYEDLTHSDMEDAFEEFLNRVEPGDDVAFIYSGHGWSDGSTNYLIPTDAPAGGSDSKLKRISVALRNGFDGVLDQLENSGARLTLAIIDACRNNPFQRPAGRKSVSMLRGLARVEAASGTFVIFSAGVGQEALDHLPQDGADQRLSVFTRTFIPFLTSGLYLEDAISEAQIRTAKLALTYQGHFQHPAYYDETLGKTCLIGTCRATLLPAVALNTAPTNQALQFQLNNVENNWNLALYEGVDFYGSDIDPRGVPAESELDCQTACENEHTCRLYTYNQRAKLCFRKKNLGLPVESVGARSGFYFRPDSLPEEGEPTSIRIHWKILAGQAFRGLFFSGDGRVNSLKECTEMCERVGCKGVTMYGRTKPYTCKMRRFFATRFLGLVPNSAAISAYPEERIVRSSQTMSITR